MTSSPSTPPEAPKRQWANNPRYSRKKLRGIGSAQGQDVLRRQHLALAAKLREWALWMRESAINAPDIGERLDQRADLITTWAAEMDV